MIQLGTYKEYESIMAAGAAANPKVYLRFDSKLFEFTILRDGSHVIELSNSKYVNSKFGDWLKENGLCGMLFISSGNGPGRNADKWIERHVNLPESEWVGEFTIYTLDNRPENDSKRIKTFPRVYLPLNSGDTDKALQEQYGDAWDGFIIQVETMHGLRYFRKLPNRQVRGTVVAVIPDDYGGIDGVMLEVWRDGKSHIVKAMGIPLWLRQSKEPHETYVGRSCIMTYTQYVSGDRVSNYTSPRVISVSTRGRRNGTQQ